MNRSSNHQRAWTCAPHGGWIAAFALNVLSRSVIMPTKRSPSHTESGPVDYIHFFHEVRLVFEPCQLVVHGVGGNVDVDGVLNGCHAKSPCRGIGGAPIARRLARNVAHAP